MAERIELPSMPTGRPEEQLQKMYSYLYKMANAMNVNMAEVGSAALTDEEQLLMNQLAVNQQRSQTDQVAPAGYSSAREQETLKSLIIKTAEFVKTQTDAYRMVLFGETEASSQFGDYRKKLGLRVDVTPEGVKQTYSFGEIVRGLKTFEINSKNYIKTGYLRTEVVEEDGVEVNVPIYGVAIGQDVVTFAEDGTETYNDGNKVAELTADELSFYQNEKLVAKYTGSRISFYSGGEEVMYIQNGEIAVVKDLKIMSGGTFDVDATNFKIDSVNKLLKTGDWRMNEHGLILLTEKSHSSEGSVPPAPDDEVLMYVGDNDDNVDGDTRPYAAIKVDTSWLAVNTAGGSRYYAIPNMMFETRGRSLDGSLGSKLGIIMGGGVAGGGYFGINSIDSNNLFNISSVNTITCVTCNQTSSRDVKHDIQDLPSEGETLDRLRPVSFIYNFDKEGKKRFGLIHEETIDILPEICTGDKDAKPGDKAINYIALVPLLLKEIQELRKRVAELERRTEQ